MRVTCKHCGGPHPAFECRKKESTAPLKEVVANGSSDFGEDASSPPQTGRVRPPLGLGSKAIPKSAGTQALPVDTNSKKGRVFAAPLGLASPANASDAKTANTKDAPKFDRKAWMREYQRNYMRNVYRPKLKASKYNPNTPERNDE